MYCMRRRLIPMNVVMAVGLFTLLSMGPDQSNPPKEVMEHGKLVYERVCLLSHTPVVEPGCIEKQSYVDNAGCKWAMEPKKKLIQAALNGGYESFAANPQQYLKIMPSLSHLSDREIADMLTYVRNSFGNKAMTITQEDVKKMRLSLAKKGKIKLS